MKTRATPECAVPETEGVEQLIEAEPGAWVAPFAAGMLAQTQRLKRWEQRTGVTALAAVFAALVLGLGGMFGLPWGRGCTATLLTAISASALFGIVYSLLWCRRMNHVERALVERGDRVETNAALIAQFSKLDAPAREMLSYPLTERLKQLRRNDSERIEPAALFRLLDCGGVGMQQAALEAIGELAPPGAAEAVVRYHRALREQAQRPGEHERDYKKRWLAVDRCITRLCERGQTFADPVGTPTLPPGEVIQQVNALVAELRQTRRGFWWLYVRRIALGIGGFLVITYLRAPLPDRSLWDRVLQATQVLILPLFLPPPTRTAAIIKKLTEMQDPRATGALALAYELSDKATRRALVPVLLGLLPRVRAQHLAGQEARHAEAIARLACVPALFYPALETIQELAPANAQSVLESLRAARLVGDEPEQVKRAEQAISDCVKAVAARRPAAVAREQLLRAADAAPSAALVRPASADTAASPEQLLRPSERG